MKLLIVVFYIELIKIGIINRIFDNNYVIVFFYNFFYNIVCIF